MQNIVIVDYGMGNLHSIEKAMVKAGELTKSRFNVVVTQDPEIILKADRLVFPGVGAIRDCMHEIKKLSLDTAIKEVLFTRPCLAICVGMQALLTDSEENGGVDCFNVLEGSVKRFPVKPGFKVPHMGWNQVHQSNKQHPMWTDIPDGSRFYFVHSYYTALADAGLSAATTDYCVAFTSTIAKENLFTTQFHPEKSAHVGIQLLNNFLQWSI